MDMKRGATSIASSIRFGGRCSTSSCGAFFDLPDAWKGLQPSIVGLMLGAAILWTMFYLVSARHGGRHSSTIYGAATFINPFSTLLMLSEYLAGIIVVCILKVIVGLTAASVIAWGGVLLRHSAVAAEVHSLHREPVLLACYRNRNHGNDLSLLDENPGAGVGFAGLLMPVS